MRSLKTPYLCQHTAKAVSGCQKHCEALWVGSLASNIKDFLVAATAHRWVDVFVNQVHSETAAPPLILILG